MKQRVKPQIVTSHTSGDTDLDEPTSPANPIAPFPPLTHKTLSSPTKLKPATRVSGGRAPEFYGFVAWLVTLLSYVLFLLWALLPDKVIHALGIHWYPTREWALLLSAWSVVVFLLAYWSYIGLGIYGTPPLNDLSTITDSRAHVQQVKAPNSPVVCEEHVYKDGIAFGAIPAPYDIPLALVNRRLLKPRRRCQWETNSPSETRN